MAAGLDRNGRAFVTIGDGIFHDVVKHAGHLVAIHKYRQVLVHINLCFLMLFVENGVELIGDLRQQQAQVDVAAREHNIGEIKACNVEELLDKRVEPVRLVKRHARKVRALLDWQLGGLLQQGKVADHAGERRAQVMRQVCDQVVLAM